MKFCSNCGAQLDDDVKFCPTCGSEVDATTETPAPALEPEPAAAVEPETTVAEPEAAQTAEEPAKKGGNAKLLNLRDKTVKFEKKHSLIVNLLVLCCSFIVIMVALFAPIKVSGYLTGRTYADVDGKDVDYTYVEVDQTIFDMIGAAFYIMPDDARKAKLYKEVQDESHAASVEYTAWAAQNPKADESEAMNARADIYAKHLSKTNFMAYMLTSYNMFEMMKSSSSSAEKYMGDAYAILVSFALGLVITILALVMVIISLINLIKAIIGMCKKTCTVNYDKYMLRMLALSGGALALMWASPMLATGGGMFGISMFVAIMLLVTSVLRSLFVRGENWLVVLKRGVTALLCMLAFYLLCANIFVYTVSNQTSSTSLHVKPGYGLYNMLTIYRYMEASAVLERMIYPMIMGFVLYVFADGFILSWTYKTYSRSIQRLANGETVKSAHGKMIASAVLMLVGIILGFLSGTLIETLSHGTVTGNYSWTMSAHVWVALVFMIGAIVFHYAFKPENIGKNKDRTVLPAVVDEPAAPADGAAAQAPTTAA